MQIPDGYNTFGTIMGPGPFQDISGNASAEQAYDLVTRQAIPLVLLARFEDSQPRVSVNDVRAVESKIEVVCVVANKTVEGSRVAKDKPWEGAATGMNARVGWVSAGIMAIMLAL